MDHRVPYEYGTFSIYAVELLGWVVILLGIIFHFRHSEEPQGDEESHTIVQGVRSFAESTPHRALALVRGLRMTFAGLVAFAFLSIFWAPDKWIALQAAIRLFEGVLLYCILRSTFYVLRPGILWSFLAGALFQSGLGIYQFLTQSSFVSTLLGMALHDPRVPGTSVVEFADERWLRAYGGLPHPNVLGGYLVVALAVTGIMWQRSQISNKWQELFLKVTAPILLTGIFFTFSRAAWIGAIGVFVWWVITTVRHSVERSEKSRTELRSARLQSRSGNAKASHYITLGMTIVYVGVLAVIYRPLVFTRAMPNSTERLEEQSRAERVSQIKESWELIKKHPLIGVGIGNYTQAVKKEIRPGNYLWTYQPVHNVPLLVFAELGVFGLVLFGSLLYRMIKHYKVNVLMLVCLIVLMMSDHYLWTLPVGTMLFWAILGLSTSYKTLDIDNS